MSVGAIVLAAGEGSDALRPVDGGTALAVVLRTLAGAAVRPVIVVLGEDASQVRAGTDLGEARIVELPVAGPSPRPTTTHPPMIASIRAGLDALPAEVDGALIWPVDRPLVSMRTLRSLIDAHSRGAMIVVPVCTAPDDEDAPPRRGHPVIFSRALFEDLRHAPDGEGAAAVVHSHPSEIVPVMTPDRGVLVDIAAPDTADLLARVKERALRLESEGGADAPTRHTRRPSRRRGRKPRGRR
jgi:molybdenum cofactor cytidylyltransferase